MADETSIESVEHQARVEKEAQDRAAVEVAEGVKVPSAVVERGAFISMQDRAKDFLKQYGHEDVSHFLSQVGSDSQLARRVVGELLEDRFGGDPAVAAQETAAEDACMSDLQAELEAAHTDLATTTNQLNLTSTSLIAARKQLEDTDAQATAQAAELSEVKKSLAQAESDRDAAGAIAADHQTKLSVLDAEYQVLQSKLTAVLQERDTLNAEFGEYKAKHPATQDEPAPTGDHAEQ